MANNDARYARYAIRFYLPKEVRIKDIKLQLQEICAVLNSLPSDNGVYLSPTRTSLSSCIWTRVINLSTTQSLCRIDNLVRTIKRAARTAGISITLAITDEADFINLPGNGQAKYDRIFEDASHVRTW